VEETLAMIMAPFQTPLTGSCLGLNFATFSLATPPPPILSLYGTLKPFYSTCNTQWILKNYGILK
jgi:hypothetical protein